MSKFSSNRPTTAGHYWFRDAIKKTLTVVRIQRGRGEDFDSWAQHYIGTSKTRDLKLCIGQWCALPNSPEEMEEYDLWVEQGNNPCKMSYTQIFNEGLAWARDGLPPEEEPEG